MRALLDDDLAVTQRAPVPVEHGDQHFARTMAEVGCCHVMTPDNFGENFVSSKRGTDGIAGGARDEPHAALE
ncbi:hypothetical protein L3i22_049610 [Actinoplanes sp. L3-i22]|nr:hypothetical protein L3i22_049610 [Actinoplanes sp. L3-i22]